MIRDNWTFYIIDPFCKDFTENVQKQYNIKYNECLNALLDEIMIPEPKILLNNEFKFIHFINCDKENNIINKNDSYEYKFIKSKFFETKFYLILNKLKNYYKKHNINVNRIYSVKNGYNIELEFFKDINH